MDDTTGEPSPPGVMESPGRDRIRPRRGPWLAWSLWLLVMAVNVLTFVLFAVPDDTQSATTLFGTAIGRFPFMAFATVGALILSRRPSNVIGWLCWAIGLAESLSGFGSVSAARSIGTDPDRLFAGLVLYQLGQVMFLLPLLGLLPLLVLLFPTGRLPSRRWWPLVWAFAAGLVLFAVSVLFKPGPLDHGLPINPLGLESAKGLLQLAGTVSTLLFPVFVVLVLVSLVLRFRRARGDEREQLKWFMFAAALLVVFGGGLGGIAERVRSPYVGPVLFVIVVSMVPVAIGVAVLRYRLYDIDRIINRTLVYGLLTAVLGLSYAGAVLLFGQLFGGVGERTPSWAVAAPPWPWPRSSSRPGAASNRQLTGASTDASTTRPRRSRRSPPTCATRSTSTPSPPSSSRSLTRPWSRPGSRSGFDPPHTAPRAQLAVRHGQRPGPT